MNNFADILPNGDQMNRPSLTDEELLRLARMLQNQGEGLASINPAEAQMLQRAGGAGNPIPGTQGYGVGGGPIRSYADDIYFPPAIEEEEEEDTVPFTAQRFVPAGSELPAIKETEPVTQLDIYDKINAGALSESDFNAANEQNIFGKDVVYQDGKVMVAQTTPPANANAMAQKVMSGEWTQAQYQQWVTANSKIQYIPWQPSGSEIDPDWKPGPAEITSVGDVVSETEGGTPKTGLAGAVSQVTGGQTTSGQSVSGAVSGATGLSPADITDLKGAIGQISISADDLEMKQLIAGSSPDSSGVVYSWLKKELEDIGRSDLYKKIEGYDLGKIWPDIMTVLSDPRAWDITKDYAAVLEEERRKKAAADAAASTTTEGVVTGSPDEKAEADIRIEEQKKSFNKDVLPGLFSDDDWEAWWKINKDSMTGTYPDLSEATMKKLFTAGMVTASDEGSNQETELVDWITTNFENKTFKGEGIRQIEEDGSVTEFTPTTYEEFKAKLQDEIPGQFNRLSEQMIRGIYNKAMDAASKKEAFDLTAADIKSFETEPPQISATDLPDVKAPQISATDFTDAVAPTMGAVEEASVTEITWTPELDLGFQDWLGTKGGLEAAGYGSEEEAKKAWTMETYLNTLRASEEELIEILKKRVAGEAPSPAELQHKRQTETNLAMLFGTTKGGTADPARIRQVLNLWRDIQQIATGQAAELRSAEQIAAENTLAATLQTAGTREASLALAKMEAEKDVALKNGDLKNVRLISIMQAKLTRVVAKFAGETDVILANMEAKKEFLIKNNEADLATLLANLQKEILIAQTNPELALQSRALDNSLALANFQGGMGEAELDVKLELADLDAQIQKELAIYGYDTQERIATLDNHSKTMLLKMQENWEREKGDVAKETAIISAVAVVMAAIITKSDRRAKKKIKPAKTEAQDFLDSLKAYSYEYKNPDSVGAKTGKILGVMAQDLEKTDLGKQMVLDTPAGKFVDYGQSLAAILASQAYLNDELKSISARI